MDGGGLGGGNMRLANMLFITTGICRISRCKVDLSNLQGSEGTVVFIDFLDFVETFPPTNLFNKLSDTDFRQPTTLNNLGTIFGFDF